jgi:hypothetical protein
MKSANRFVTGVVGVILRRPLLFLLYPRGQRLGWRLRRDVLDGHHVVVVVLPADDRKVRPFNRAELLGVELAEREFDSRETFSQALRIVLAPLMAQDLNTDLAAGAGCDEQKALAGLGIFQRQIVLETPGVLRLPVFVGLPLGLV